ncbi:hypothetical protein D3C71_1180200 [compost metagenome]
MFDQKPLFLLARHVGAHQVPQAFELLALQLELELALGIGLGGILLGNPHATVPDNHIARTVMAFGDAAFEAGVVQRMVFDVHRQALDLGVQRRALGHRPALERAIEFQAKVIMQARGVVLLDAELQGVILGVFSARTFDGGRLRRRRKIAHAVVVIEILVHGSPAGRCRVLNQHFPPSAERVISQKIPSSSKLPGPTALHHGCRPPFKRIQSAGAASSPGEQSCARFTSSKLHRHRSTSLARRSRCLPAAI